MAKTSDFPYIGRLEGRHLIRTDDPLGEIWKTFLKFTDFHYLAPRWAELGSQDLTRVATYLRQAYEYHLGSNATTLLTRPVLSYYSFMNLAKAVLLLTTDSTPSDYHGLCRHTMDDSFLRVSGETNDGVFRDLASALGSPVGNGVRFDIEDFVLNTVELRYSYRDYFSKDCLIIAPAVRIYMDGRINVRFLPSEFLGLDRAGFLDVLSERTHLFDDFEEEFDASDQETVGLRNKVPIDPAEISSQASELLARHFTFSVFESPSYYLNLNKKEKQLHPGAAYFGIMFLLSSISRYEPKYLDQFVNVKETSVNWFFREVCELAERAFPNLLLNRLYNYNLMFASGFSL